MITLKNLSKVYRTTEVETTALRAMNLEIRSGEFVAVMGPSGCGKSTFLNIVGMLDSPSAGEYWFDGRNIVGYSENALSDLRKNAIGFVFQSFNLLSRTSALENVELPMVYAGVRSRERHRRAEEALQRVGLGDRVHHAPNQLSGGQQQRVAIARALLPRPDVVFADEPTGNLDSRSGAEVLGLLRSSVKETGQTVVMVTHDPSAAAYADRVVLLADGRVAGEVQSPSLASVTEALQALAVNR